MQHAAIMTFLLWSTSASLFERQTTLQVSSSGSCGSVNGIDTTCLGSVQGNCCSYLGFCGSNSSYCGAGCQSAFGLCGDSKISTDGSCGPGPGWTCLGASMGNCCSVNGYCGDTAGHCGAGCQTEFGDCYDTTGGANTTAPAASGGSSVPAASATALTSASATPPAVAAAPQKSVTDSAGFKAGMAVMAIAIAGIIAAIGFLLWRRRRSQQAAGKGNEGAYTYDQKELGAGATPEPRTYHELGNEQRMELDSDSQRQVPYAGHDAGSNAYKNEPSVGVTYELPAGAHR